MLSSDHAFPQWNLRDFFSLLQLLTRQVCGGALPSAIPGHRCLSWQLLPVTHRPADAPGWGTRVTSSAHPDQAVSQPAPVAQPSRTAKSHGCEAGDQEQDGLSCSDRLTVRRNLKWGQDLVACSKDLSAADIHPIIISKINESAFTPSSQTGEGFPQLYEILCTTGPGYQAQTLRFPSRGAVELLSICPSLAQSSAALVWCWQSWAKGGLEQ